jgi:hypothetical protein
MKGGLVNWDISFDLVDEDLLLIRISFAPGLD